jgi:UDP-N-acetylmuramate--alanine ligase
VRLGVDVQVGHAAENVIGADVVVYSSAVAQQNPEVVAAQSGGIPVITRGEMLAELMRMKYAIVIAGSHGKTTTTSLVATVLRAAGLDPTVVVGGRMASLGSNARLGAGELLVAESDESDGSFLRLSPTIAAVTNVDPEHLDFYGSHEALKQAFVAFANRVPFYGLSVLCLDHPHVRDLLPQITRRYVTYGLSRQADFVADNVRYAGLETLFRVRHREQPLGEFKVRMPGEHNVLNCLAVIAIADELAVPIDVVKQALATFRGVARRFTVVAEPHGIALVDDYSHHPVEIQAALNAARNAYSQRILVAFQPHRYTRTRALFHEFSTAFDQADAVFVTDVYAAGEAPIEGATGEALAEGIARQGHRAARYVKDRRELEQLLAEQAQPGDVVIALGAGDINRVLGPLEASILQLRGPDPRAAKKEAE